MKLCARRVVQGVADAVGGLPVPLPGLRRMAEPVRSTRLQTFLTVLNFQHCQGITGNNGFRTKSLLSFAHEASACAVCRCQTIFQLIGPTKL